MAALLSMFFTVPALSQAPGSTAITPEQYRALTAQRNELLGRLAAMDARNAENAQVVQAVKEQVEALNAEIAKETALFADQTKRLEKKAAAAEWSRNDAGAAHWAAERQREAGNGRTAAQISFFIATVLAAVLVFRERRRPIREREKTLVGGAETEIGSAISGVLDPAGLMKSRTIPVAELPLHPTIDAMRKYREDNDDLESFVIVLNCQGLRIPCAVWFRPNEKKPTVFYSEQDLAQGTQGVKQGQRWHDRVIGAITYHGIARQCTAPPITPTRVN